MDPTTAWNTVIDESLDVDERIEAAHALRDWLDSGGFPPLPPIGRPIGLSGQIARHYIDRRVDEVLRLEVDLILINP